MQSVWLGSDTKQFLSQAVYIYIYVYICVYSLGVYTLYTAYILSRQPPIIYIYTHRESTNQMSVLHSSSYLPHSWNGVCSILEKEIFSHRHTHIYRLDIHRYLDIIYLEVKIIMPPK